MIYCLWRRGVQGYFSMESLDLIIIVLTCRHGVELPTRKKKKKKTRIDKLRNFWTTASVNSVSRESFKEHKEHFLAGACSFNCSMYSQISVDVTMCCTDVNTKPLTGNLKAWISQKKKAKKINLSKLDKCLLHILLINSSVSVDQWHVRLRIPCDEITRR